MPLEILAPGVALGVTMIVGLIHLMGLSEGFKLRDETMAREIFLTDYPNAGVGDCFLDEDRKAAVLMLDDGGIGLITAMGDDPVCRAYALTDRPRSVRSETGLKFILGEFGLADVEMRLTDAEALQIVMD